MRSGCLIRIGDWLTISLDQYIKYSPFLLEAIKLDLHSAFKVGARRIAKDEKAYTDLHKAHGIEQAHWELLTQDEYWTPDQQRAIRSVLANVIEVSMTIAGMPAIPLPGQYAAALIAEVVSPCNYMVACVKAPDTFDATDASGLLGPMEVKNMEYQQMMALVIAYAGGYGDQPNDLKLPRVVAEKMGEANTDKRTKKTA